MGSGEEAGIVLSDSQQAVLTAVCDTVVPSLARNRDPDGLWGRKASDIGVDAGAALLISEIPDPELRGGLLQLIDALGGQGITRAPSQESREQILRNTALSDPRAAAGVAALIGMTLFLHYGAPDPQTGKNPNWETFGYPGPISAPPEVEKPLKIEEPQGSEETIEADVCIVGSGSGGSVVAAVLASRGLDVVVLEAAGYYNESDFTQLELPAYQQMFWRGGPTPTADGNVSLVAGTTLGGGTTINWTNCLRTRPWVREQWAEHGLGDVGESAFDRHLDAVLERISANDQLQRLERDPAEAARGDGGAGLELRDDRAEQRPRQVLARDGGVPRLRRPVRQQAERGPDLARRRAGARGPLPHLHPRHARPRSRAAGPPVSRRSGSHRTGEARRSRSGPHGWSSPADRSSRPHYCCDRESVAPRSATTCDSIHRASSAAPTAPISRPGGAPRRPASATSSRTRVTAMAS